MQSARAIQLLGAQAILVGISPEVAQTLIGLGVDFSALATRATLQDGFEYARKQLERTQGHRPANQTLKALGRDEIG
jgi:rsbT co-antagonist protein RsbR